MTKKSQNNDQLTELTADLQRIRADFENYRKQVERENQKYNIEKDNWIKEDHK